MAGWNLEAAVNQRYGNAAEQREQELCCPVSYDSRFLEVIPKEVIDRDYGCGDPSAYLADGETVLDLGSGGGKICFIAAQIVGPKGRVIGVDMNPAMLRLARRSAPVIARRIGFANVEFREGKIQDLAFDPEKTADYCQQHPVTDSGSALELEAFIARQRAEQPLIEDASVDVVVSNCVLNLVRSEEKTELFREIYRVTKDGGRAVISDIVSDEDVPAAMQEDPELWSGCISGALREDEFLEAFAKAGFYGIRVRKRDHEPWRTVDGIEFRALTVEAFKGKEGPCLERKQAVVYKGPFSEVVDDDGHRIQRGVRYAVCDKTFRIFSRAPYAEHFDAVEPLEEVPLQEARAFDCSRDALRHPRETKGKDYNATTEADGCCCS